MSDIKFVYWDLGNVIVTDNLGARLFGQFGIDYNQQQKDAWARHRVGATTEDEYLHESLAGTGKEAQLEDVRRTSYALLNVTKKSALPLLFELDGRVKQGILSNHSLGYARRIKDIAAIESFVEPHQLIISAEVKLAKPDQRIFALATERAGVDTKHILFYDDKQENIDAARTHGWNAEVYTTPDPARKSLRSYNL